MIWAQSAIHCFLSDDRCLSLMIQTLSFYPFQLSWLYDRQTNIGFQGNDCPFVKGVTIYIVFDTKIIIIVIEFNEIEISYNIRTLAMET